MEHKIEKIIHYDPFDNAVAQSFIVELFQRILKFEFGIVSLNDVDDFILKRMQNFVQESEVIMEILTYVAGFGVHSTLESEEIRVYPKISIESIDAVVHNFFYVAFGRYVGWFNAYKEIIDDMLKDESGEYLWIKEYPSEYREYLEDLKLRNMCAWEKIQAEKRIDDEGNILYPIKVYEDSVEHCGKKVHAIYEICTWYVQEIAEKNFNWRHCVGPVGNLFYDALDLASGTVGFMKNEDYSNAIRKIRDVLRSIEDIFDDVPEFGGPFDIMKIDLGKGNECCSIDCIKDLDRLKTIPSVDEKIISNENIKIVFSYPVLRPISINFWSAGGFSKRDLLACIHDGYSTIYGEEKNESGDSHMVPGTYNRELSNGPHGIWGHELGNLVIEGLHYSPAINELCMQIGS